MRRPFVPVTGIVNRLLCGAKLQAEESAATVAANAVPADPLRRPADKPCSAVNRFRD